MLLIRSMRENHRCKFRSLSTKFSSDHTVTTKNCEGRMCGLDETDWGMMKKQE